MGGICRQAQHGDARRSEVDLTGFRPLFERERTRHHRRSRPTTSGDPPVVMTTISPDAGNTPLTAVTLT